MYRKVKSIAVKTSDLQLGYFNHKWTLHSAKRREM